VQLIGSESLEPGGAVAQGNAHLILDGGTGLALLQRTLMRGPWGKGYGELHLLLSHYHWDHLIGVPFFGPMFVKGNRIAFYGSSVNDLRSSIEQLFTSVYSPLNGAENLAAEVEYCQIEPGGMEVGGFHVRAVTARHSAVTLAFRIEYGPHSVVYTTDHGVGDEAVDAKLVELARGADLWILDAQFTPEQRLDFQGWWHTSHLGAVKLALQAGVQMAILFHHDPANDDAVLDRMGQEAAEMAAKRPEVAAKRPEVAAKRPAQWSPAQGKVAADSGLQVLMARDGMVVDVGA